ELIYAVMKEFPIDRLFSSGEEINDNFLAEQGRNFMDLLIREADSDAYRDRTGEMIEKVAEQTGIRFPHVFERYVELGILALRPRDAWNVTEATTRALKVHNYNCSLGKMFAEKGLNNCHVFCLAANEVAADKARMTLNMTCSKAADDNGLCEFEFRVPQGG
ncbi:MAG TPA: hypothetical protein VMV58_02035, partial [Desulfosporosinus sp.]|nr:hypothetical protein [Desulfosporosinus sp.]